MAKHTISGFIIYRTESYWSPEERISFTCFAPGPKDDGRVVVSPHSFDVDVPDNFDPRPHMVASLRAAKEQARAEFAAKVTEYDRKINELLALEMS